MQSTPQDRDDDGFGEGFHGIADWPFGARAKAAPLPSLLPDGTPWPRLRVLVLPMPDGHGLAATLASIERQDHPRIDCDVVEAGSSAIADALSDAATRSIVLIRSGDLLAPGALAALALEATLATAQVVVGLRVRFDRGVRGLDVLAHPPGPIDPAFLDMAEDGEVASILGGALFDRAAIVRAGGLDPSDERRMVELWRRMAVDGGRLARIGRPVLLQRMRPEDRPVATPGGLSIVSLTDTGYTAGAGIAHRRLTEALSLAGHRIAHVVLTRESPPTAAEWTDAFPRSEADILAGGHDLVLAGNLHGATRSIAILERLGARLPVSAILHDLFPLTGRCAFPKDCPVIAAGCDATCPTPDLYPQLEPSRIARAYAAKRDVLAGPCAPLLLANSDWTAQSARTLAPAGTAIATMDLAFPSGVFRPGDRAAARRALGLPADDILVMFGAVIVDAPGKGFSDLSAVLNQVARPGVRFVAVGRLDDPSVFGLADLIVAGPIADEAVLARWYIACDVYVTASQTETLGQTPIEAALCGTPSIAYRACGLTTAIIDGVSGLLAPLRADDLAARLSRLIEDEDLRRDLGAWGRIALENRNSYAAAAMRLHDVFAARGLLPKTGLAGRAPRRIGFSPALIEYFAFARTRYPGHTGTLAPEIHPLLRRLRVIKHALIGRGMPLGLRRALHLAGVIRRRFDRRR